MGTLVKTVLYFLLVRSADRYSSIVLTFYIMYSLVPSNINSSYNIDNTSSNGCRIELQWQVCSYINDIYVYIHSIIDVPIQITDMDNTTLRPDVFYRIAHNISGDMNTINISGNEWNISVQANMTYEFSVTPVNMFTNGSTTSKYIV